MLGHARAVLGHYEQMAGRGWRHAALDVMLVADARARLATLITAFQQAPDGVVAFAAGDRELLARTARLLRQLEPDGFVATVPALEALAARLPPTPASSQQPPTRLRPSPLADDLVGCATVAP